MYCNPHGALLSAPRFISLAKLQKIIDMHNRG